MSSGCIPVVSNVGGIKQLSFDGFGHKFGEFNAVAIAKVIVAYASDPIKSETESLNAKRFAEENFPLTKQLHEIVALYKELTI
jgi:glycosyltransferase involved in cell wall biosynthesis